MKALVTKEFPGRPDREFQTRTIEVGETIDGDLGTVAIENGWADPVGENGKPVKKRRAKSTPRVSKKKTEKPADLLGNASEGDSGGGNDTGGEGGGDSNS